MHKKFIYIPLTIFFLISIITLYFNMSYEALYIKQAIWYIFGFFIFIIIRKIGNEKIIRNIEIIYIIFNILLFLLLLFASPINNSKCWFKIGSITIQPSEFMKIILIIFLSKILSENIIFKKSELSLICYSFIITLIPSILTFLEPDTGVVIIYFIIFLSILYVAGIDKNWFIFLFLFVSLILSIVFFIYNLNSNLFIKIFGDSLFLRIDRIINWTTKSGYQLENSLISIGSSGFIGHHKAVLYFPESETDFIFSLFTTIFGFLGNIILITSIVIFDLYILNIKSKYKINKLIIVGFIFMISYQQIQNISMTFGLLPITGITLPFISYGGSSLISYFIVLAIICNINDKNKQTYNLKKIKE